jgi:surface polysaccharide O-acyltransferase-like enzyme
MKEFDWKTSDANLFAHTFFSWMFIVVGLLLGFMYANEQYHGNFQHTTPGYLALLMFAIATIIWARRSYLARKRIIDITDRSHYRRP